MSKRILTITLPICLFAASLTVVAKPNNGGGPILTEDQCESLWNVLWTAITMYNDCQTGALKCSPWGMVQLLSLIYQASKAYSDGGCEAYMQAPPMTGIPPFIPPVKPVPPVIKVFSVFTSIQREATNEPLASINASQREHQQVNDIADWVEEETEDAQERLLAGEITHDEWWEKTRSIHAERDELERAVLGKDRAEIYHALRDQQLTAANKDVLRPIVNEQLQSVEETKNVELEK